MAKGRIRYANKLACNVKQAITMVGVYALIAKNAGHIGEKPTFLFHFS